MTWVANFDINYLFAILGVDSWMLVIYVNTEIYWPGCILVTSLLS